MKSRKKIARYLAGLLSLVMIFSSAMSSITLASESGVEGAVVTEEKTGEQSGVPSSTSTEGTQPTQPAPAPVQQQAPAAVAPPAPAPASTPAPAPVTEQVTPTPAPLTTEYIYEDDDKKVVATLTDGTAIPEGSELKVRKLTDNMEKQEDKDKFNWVNNSMNEKAAADKFALDGYEYYDIYFLYNGSEIAPSTGEMKVTVTYKKENVPDAYKNSTQSGKEIKVFQLTEGKNENNETIYNMEDLAVKEQLLKLEADEAGNIKTAELNEKTFLPLAIVWKEDPKAEENNQPASPEEEKKPEITKEEVKGFKQVYKDGKVIISVTADEGVVPEGAELSITPIEKQKVPEDASKEEKEKIEKVNKLYKDTEKKLEDSKGEDKEIEAFIAYDISFIINGEEVEPNGDVNVDMDFVKSVLPEGVSDKAKVKVNHLEEDKDAKGDVKVVDITSESDIVTTNGVAVENVNLTSGTFSTFVIKWEKDEYAATVYYVNEKGEEIDGYQEGTLAVGDDEWVDLNKMASEISEYRFKEARINDPTTGTVVNQIRCDDGERWEHRAGPKSTRYTIQGWNNKSTEERKIYLIYEKSGTGSLTTVKTVDSASAGIVMKMSDYDKAPWPEDYGNGSVKQGLVKEKLGKNGYPIGAKPVNQNVNFKNLFNGRSVNHLFLQSTFDETGYYEYSSFENYAYLGNSTNFTVYDQLGTPRDVPNAAFYFQRGNFMPYNMISADNKAKHVTNLYDEDGNNLNKDSARWNETLYKTYKVNPDSENNYLFGMSLDANFIQAKGGVVEHKGESNPMVYKFNGDDDLWVFIDGALVLDIGGCHDAHSGEINFKTGDIWVQIDKNNKKTTTIKECFKNAGIFPDGTDWVDSKKEINKYFTGNTFKDHSTHNMKMFYMERGEGASNLHMKFNLPVIPEQQIQIKKELEQETDPVKYGNVNFGFELYIEDDTTPEVYTKVTAADIEKYAAEKALKNGEHVDLTIDKEGRFYLKPEETALFNNIPENVRYYVKEVDVQSDEYDEVQVNGTRVTEHYDDDSKNTIYEAKSSEKTAAERPLVVFTNSCSAKNLRALTVEKVMAESQTTDDEFTINVKLEDADGKLKDYNGKYRFYENADTPADQYKEKTTEDGNITLKAGQHIIINNILSDTNYLITEPGLSDNYAEPVITVTGNNPATIEGATGSIKLGENSKVTVTNKHISDEDYVKKNVEFSKTAQVTDWDKRQYDINLTAKSTVIGKGKADIVLLLDNSSSMGSTSYGGKTREQNLREGVDAFIDSAAKNSPDSRIAIITFDKDSTKEDRLCGFTRVGNGSELKTVMREKYKRNSGTRQDLGLANVEDYLKSEEKTNPRFVVLFTDGEPYPSDKRDDICQDAYDTANRIKKDATMYTVGLAVRSGLTCTYTTADRETQRNVSVLQWLSSLASDANHAIEANDTTNLTKLFANLQESISENASVIIRDVIDARFKLQDGEKKRLEGLGAKVTENEDKTTTIEWPVTATKEGWTGKISIVAREEFIGGNNIATNVWDNSTIEYDKKVAHLVNKEDENPAVNVKADLQVNNNETTIFWGDAVPADGNVQNQLFDITKPSGQVKISDTETITSEYTGVSKDALELKWYTDKDCTNEITLDAISKEKPDPEVAEYYLKVVYTGLGAPTAASLANTDNHVAGDADDNYKLTAHNANPDTSRLYGVYKVNIVTGELNIIKLIDEQYTDITKINANQSFVFKIERRDEKGGDVTDTYYEVLSFDANKDHKGLSSNITGLKKGYYTVTEETEWSSKYTLTDTEDNDTNNKEAGKDLYIGRTIYTENETLYVPPKFYGLESKYGSSSPIAQGEYAEVTFTNNIKSDWNFLSDVAAAINKFTKKAN